MTLKVYNYTFYSQDKTHRMFDTLCISAIYFAASSGAGYCVGRLSVCLSVCGLYLSHIARTIIQTAPNFFVLVAYSRGSVIFRQLLYLLPVLWMALSPIIGIWRRRRKYGENSKSLTSWGKAVPLTFAIALYVRFF